MSDRRTTGVGNEREPLKGVHALLASLAGEGGFDWAGFFRNPNIMVLAVLYALLFYMIGPSPRDVRWLLVWLLFFLPMCLLNLMGTHQLKVLIAKRAKQG